MFHCLLPLNTDHSSKYRGDIKETFPPNQNVMAKIDKGINDKDRLK